MEVIRDWNRALLFTGQGIQPEDVIKYASQLREIDEDLLEANTYAAEKNSGLPIADYLVRPEGIFTNNAALQMVVHTLNVTAGDLALTKFGDTNGLVAAGHSLGEVAAFDIARVFLTRAESMEFVSFRGRFMQRDHEQGPGNLYRIDGLTEEQLLSVSLELEISPALINGPTLLMVGSNVDRNDLEEPLKEAGARRVMDLKIPAFHTFYMARAQTDLEAYNRQRKYQTASFYIVSNYDGEPGLDGYELLVKHITSITNPVRWTDVIATINHPGVTFYTLGPGSNLAALNRLNGVPKERTKDLLQLLAE